MDLEEYLLDKKEEIKGVKVIQRDINVTLGRQFITVLVGPRRAGKSFLIYDIIKNKFKLQDADYIYINLEDVELELNPRLLKDAIRTHISIYGKEPQYIFLDEVQNLPKWERALASIHEGSRYRIVITGSNSKVTSKEVATYLRGRAVTNLVLPLSFKEFVRFRYKKEFPKILSSYSEARMIRKFKEYMDTGGFPQVVLALELKDQFFSDYIDVVIYRDVVERYKVRNMKLLRYLISSIVSSSASTFSINKVFRDVKSTGMKVSKKTVYNYYLYILNSFLFFGLKKFAKSIRTIEKSLPKIYLCDHGFVEGTAKKFENIVFLELVRKYGLKNLFYFSTPTSELDFYLRKQRTAIQVAYKLSKQAMRREINGLKLLPSKKKYIISLKKSKFSVGFFEFINSFTRQQ